MASQAATIDVLVKKAKFEPQVAVAVAEAIDLAMNDSQFVTIPVLDARFAEHRAEIRADLLRLEHKVDGVRAGLEHKLDAVRTGLEHKIDTVRTDLEHKIDTVRTDLEHKIDSSFATLDKKIDVAVATLGEKNERTKSELVRWVFGAIVGNAVVSGGAAWIIHALEHH